MAEYRTKSGRVLTDEDIRNLAEEAEAGYDIRAEWIGSRLAAPGPGARVNGEWRLLGTVERVSEADRNSIKVHWDNGRVTIERRSNLDLKPGRAPNAAVLDQSK